MSSPDAWAALQGYLDCKVPRDRPLANGFMDASEASGQTGVNKEPLVTSEPAQGGSLGVSTLGSAANGQAAERSPAQVRFCVIQGGFLPGCMHG